MSSKRSNRISEEIRKVISDLILRGLKDPKISRFTSITEVRTTRDLRFAYVFISVYDPKANKKQTLDGLNRAKGYIRNEIGKAIDLRYTPEPIFKMDDSVDNAMHIQEILNKVSEKNDNLKDDPYSDYEDYEIEDEDKSLDDE